MLKVSLQQFYRQPRDLLEPYLKKWHYWATRCRIIPVIDVAATIKSHWKGIIHTATTGTTNGIPEGYNSLVQAAKAKARGYRNVQNFINIIYLIGGGLAFLRPTHSVEEPKSISDNTSVGTATRMITNLLTLFINAPPLSHQ